MEKILLWDFDGTLGYRKNGMWGTSMIDALKEYDPHTKLTAPDFYRLCCFINSALVGYDFMWVCRKKLSKRTGRSKFINQSINEWMIIMGEAKFYYKSARHPINQQA